MQLLDGRPVAQAWQAEIRQQVEHLQSRGITPGLAVVLVGTDPASILYTSMKERTSRALEFHSDKVKLAEDATTEVVVQAVTRLNHDAAIHGILVQLPLPETIDTQVVLEAIDPVKDVDGLHPQSLGRLLMGDMGVLPATPRGILALLDHYQISTEGQHVVIVGRSNILGKPLAAVFVNRDATVTVCHSKTQDLAKLTRQADLIVMDTGVPGLLKGSMVKAGVVVIDAGISKLPSGKVVGDARFDDVAARARAITPVPGGVGPMTISALLQNTLDRVSQTVHPRGVQSREQ